MKKLFAIIYNSNMKTMQISNLHRWGNHFNKNCVDRINNCMSIQWNDYSSDSCSNKINEITTKKIDQEYGHLFKINQDSSQEKNKKESQIYNYNKDYNKDFEKYFYIEMRASMMI